jgi:alcohol dehydrogenase (NADP+)
MGANVTAISHSASKKADAEAMGATTFIATHGGEDTVKAHARTLDLIIVTTNDPRMPLDDYIGLLKAHGTLIFVCPDRSYSYC